MIKKVKNLSILMNLMESTLFQFSRRKLINQQNKTSEKSTVEVLDSEMTSIQILVIKALVTRIAKALSIK